MKHKEKSKKPSIKNFNIKKPEKKDDFVSWYEIPAANMDRAMHFYSSIFDVKFEPVHTGTHTMAFFPAETGVGGAIVFGDGSVPSQTGALLYLNAGPSLDEPLSKIATAGGQILMGKTLISEEIGYYSLILDSEGNRLALYSKA